MIINKGYLNNIQSIQDKPVKNQVTRKPAMVNDNFGEILQEKIDRSSGLKFSKHAEIRLQARNINLSNEQVKKITDAAARAEGKGVRDSLIILDNLAFVVNVKNKTVITAVNSSEIKDNVFTNIDGAVFA